MARRTEVGYIVRQFDQQPRTSRRRTRWSVGRWPDGRPVISSFGWVAIGCLGFWLVVCGALYLFIVNGAAR
jgi:hypothetical protein